MMERIQKQQGFLWKTAKCDRISKDQKTSILLEHLQVRERTVKQHTLFGMGTGKIEEKERH